MSIKVETGSCYSCNRALRPEQVGSVHFPCPQCGAKIVRCADCRRLSNNYVCQGCKFEGP